MLVMAVFCMLFLAYRSGFFSQKHPIRIIQLYKHHQETRWKLQMNLIWTEEYMKLLFIKDDNSNNNTKMFSFLVLIITICNRPALFPLYRWRTRNGQQRFSWLGRQDPRFNTCWSHLVCSSYCSFFPVIIMKAFLGHVQFLNNFRGSTPE